MRVMIMVKVTAESESGAPGEFAAGVQDRRAQVKAKG